VPTESQVVYAPHAFQKQVHRSTANYRVIVAGRQSGKTLAAVHETATWAMSAPRRWPDEKRPQFWWVTAFDGTQGKAWRDFEATIPLEIVARKHESEAWFELKNGSRISMQSAEGMKSLVSEKLHGLVCDEFCQYREAVYEQYLGPMLLTTGGPVIFCGSPWGMNWGYRTALSAQRTPNWSYHHWSSFDSPYANAAYLEQERLRMPERAFRQQYLAEFLTDGGELFRNIDNAIAPAGVPDDSVVIGLDLARTKDWSHLYAFNARGEWVDSKRIGHLGWDVQRIAVMEMYRRLKARKVVIDVTGIRLGEEAVAGDLRREGLIVEAINLGGESKTAVIRNLMWRFDMNAIRIAMDTAEEFRRYTAVSLASGHERYTAPEGEHDDQVMAAALAMWGLRQYNAVSLPESKTELDNALDREMRDDPDNWTGGPEFND